MNDSKTTNGGYIGSKMRTDGLEQAKETILSAFNDLVLTHRDYLANAVTDDRVTSCVWEDSTVELMNEIEVYGAHIRASMNGGNTFANIATTGKQQFSLFAINPKKVNIRGTYWLRDVVNSSSFALMYFQGYASYGDATYSLGVRPYFCIG